VGVGGKRRPASTTTIGARSWVALARLGMTRGASTRAPSSHRQEQLRRDILVALEVGEEAREVLCYERTRDIE
jgi:hypothetical protein